MTEVLATAVRDRQGVPRRPIELVVDGEPWCSTATSSPGARTRARRTGAPHNGAAR